MNYRSEKDLGAAMLAFERKQAFLLHRPKLPSDKANSIAEISQQQLRILGHIDRHGPSTSIDISKTLRIKQASVSTNLSLLSENTTMLKKMFTIRVPVQGKQKNGNRTKQLWVYGIPADGPKDF